MYKKILTILLFSLYAASAFGYSVEKVNVDPVGDFVLGPSKIEVFLDPGQTITKTITITNRQNARVSFKVQAEDFVGTTNPENPITLLGDQRSKYSFIDHIVPEIKEFELGFGERVSIPIRIEVPEDASPGGYYTSVIISNEPEKVNVDGASGAIAVSRVGTLLFIRVNGDVREEGALEDFRVSGPSKRFIYSEAPTQFEVLFSNKGSVHLAPYGNVEMKNLFGRVVNRAPIDAFFVLPDSLRFREVAFEESGFMFGRYTATVELFRGYDNLKDYKTISFWVIPWSIIFIFLAIIAVLYGVYRFLGSHFEIRRK